MKPTVVQTTVDRPIQEVWDHLDRLANHEAFTDHMLTHWSITGPERGVGAKVRVKGKGGDWLDIEVIEADPPRHSVERTVGAKGKRVSTGTYELTPVDERRTRVQFTLDFQQMPRRERMLSPLLALYLRRLNDKAMARLKQQLESG